MTNQFELPKRSQVVFLHLKKGAYANDLVVTKVAKTRDAQVDPGVVIVKANISVPGNFFEEALPYVEINFEAGDEVPPADVSISVEREGEAS